jgi:hypothetical protein
MKWVVFLWVFFALGCSSNTKGNGTIIHIGDGSVDSQIDMTIVNIGADSDEDGLGDVSEEVVGTDPMNPDTDGDGVLDGREFSLGSNPLVADSDGDGQSDGAEVEAGTNPINADTDGDGFPDAQERTGGTDPTDPFSWDFDGGVWPDLSGHAQGVYADGWQVGSILANLAFIDQLGGLIELYRFYGYVILLDFSAGWCMPCRRTAETAQAAWTVHRDQGVMFIHLLTEGNRPGTAADAELMTDWAELYGISFPVVRQDDSAGYEAFQTSDAYSGSLPFLVLIDRDMRIDSTYGANQDQAIEARIEALLEDEVELIQQQKGPGPGATTEICDQDQDGVQNTSCGGLDCHDRDETISPQNDEVCDAVDHNCDGQIHGEATDAIALFMDADSDAYGDPNVMTQGCQPYWPYVSNSEDCDDADQTVNPETLWYLDMDRDGSGNPNESTMACERPDGYVNNSQDADDTQASAGCWASVTVGRDHACGLRTDGRIRCWGGSSFGRLDAPEGDDFIEVSAGYRHSCALRRSGQVECWGTSTDGATTPPDSTFESVSCGLDFCCGLTDDPNNNISCWGSDADQQTTPPPGLFALVSAGGGRHACAIDNAAQAQCWGLADGFRGAPSPTAVPVGDYATLNSGHYLTCAVTTSGEGRCWGSNSQNQHLPPEGTYQHIIAGTVHSCGVTSDGEVRCFGSSSLDRTNSPEGHFVQVDVNQLHSCAVSDNGLITCWGIAEDDRLNPTSCSQ